MIKTEWRFTSDYPAKIEAVKLAVKPKPAPLVYTPMPTTHGMYEPSCANVEPWAMFELWPGQTEGVRRPVAEVAISPEEWAIYRRVGC